MESVVEALAVEAGVAVVMVVAEAAAVEVVEEEAAAAATFLLRRVRLPRFQQTPIPVPAVGYSVAVFFRGVIRVSVACINCGQELLSLQKTV